jgi:hypothetical protein
MGSFDGYALSPACSKYQEQIIRTISAANDDHVPFLCIREQDVSCRTHALVFALCKVAFCGNFDVAWRYPHTEATKAQSPRQLSIGQRHLLRFGFFIRVIVADAAAVARLIAACQLTEGAARAILGCVCTVRIIRSSCVVPGATDIVLESSVGKSRRTLWMVVHPLERAARQGEARSACLERLVHPVHLGHRELLVIDDCLNSTQDMRNLVAKFFHRLDACKWKSSTAATRDGRDNKLATSVRASDTEKTQASESALTSSAREEKVKEFEGAAVEKRRTITDESESSAARKRCFDLSLWPFNSYESIVGLVVLGHCGCDARGHCDVHRPCLPHRTSSTNLWDQPASITRWTATFLDNDSYARFATTNRHCLAILGPDIDLRRPFYYLVFGVGMSVTLNLVEARRLGQARAQVSSDTTILQDTLAYLARMLRARSQGTLVKPALFPQKLEDRLLRRFDTHTELQRGYRNSSPWYMNRLHAISWRHRHSICADTESHSGGLICEMSFVQRQLGLLMDRNSSDDTMVATEARRIWSESKRIRICAVCYHGAPAHVLSANP